MISKKNILSIFLISFVFFLGCAQNRTSFIQQQVDDSILLTLSKLNWSVVVEYPGFKILDKGIRKDGKGAYFQAKNKDGINISVYLDKAPYDGDTKACRKFYWDRLRNSDNVKEEDVRMSEYGKMAILEYNIKLDAKRNVYQKNLNAYLVNDGYWIDIHLSTVIFPQDNGKLFFSILDKIKIYDKKI